MITTQLAAPTALFRVNTPKWAFAPLSGAGAAAHGGRFNRPGLEALYLSLDAVTALAEYQQTSPHLPPGTICSYAAHLPPLVDLRELGNGVWDPIWQDWAIDWRAMYFNEHIEPPTWDMGDMAIAAGSPGIIFPSTANPPAGINVVLFLTELTAPGGGIDVIDPGHLLPQNAASWPSTTP